MPYSYYVRSAIYEAFAYATFETCEPGTFSAVCIQEAEPGVGVPGTQIVEAYSYVMPIASSEDNTWRDIAILVAIGVFWKIVYAVGVIVKTRRVAAIGAPDPTAYARRGNGKEKSSLAQQNKVMSSPKENLSMAASQLTTKRIPFEMPDNLSDEVSV